jgi:hypothetical protein
MVSLERENRGRALGLMGVRPFRIDGDSPFTRSFSTVRCLGQIGHFVHVILREQPEFRSASPVAVAQAALLIRMVQHFPDTVRRLAEIG